MDNTPCLEERGYYGAVKLEKNFADKARQEAIDNVAVQAQRGDAYADLRNKKSFAKINSEITNEKQAEVTLQRLSASPDIKFTQGDISVKVRLQDKLLDVYI